MAERGGFEPPVELPLLQFSRLVRSAAPASLLTTLGIMPFFTSFLQR